MAYASTDGVDPTKPVGSSTPAANIDDHLRTMKTDYNERLDDVMGVDFATDDPIEPTKYGSNVTIDGAQISHGIHDAGNSGTEKTIDFDDGNFQKLTLTANCTLSVSNMKLGTSYVLFIVQDGAGGHTLTLHSDLVTSGGAALSLSTTAGRVNLVSITPYTTSKGLVSLAGSNYNVS